MAPCTCTSSYASQKVASATLCGVRLIVLHFLPQILHPKSDVQRSRLVEAVGKIFLFKSLDQVYIWLYVYVCVYSIQACTRKVD